MSKIKQKKKNFIYIIFFIKHKFCDFMKNLINKKSINFLSLILNEILERFKALIIHSMCYTIQKYNVRIFIKYGILFKILSNQTMRNISLAFP